MEKNDDSSNLQSSSDRPGKSEGIGLPSQSSGSGVRQDAGFGVTGAFDGSASESGSARDNRKFATSESHECTHCGQSHVKGSDLQGFDKILGTVGINDQAIQKMRESLENLDLDSYFAQAKEYFGDSATKAKNYAKDHKAIIGAALAVVAVGAGVLIATKSKSGDRFVTPRIDERDIPRA